MGDESSVKFKVIGAGFGRTGTSSFKKALEILGFGPCYHMVEVFKNSDGPRWEEYAENSRNLPLIDDMFVGNGYISSCDFPCAPYWREQLEMYPEAKVILTIRDPEKWYQSCIDTIFKMLPNHPECSFGVRIAYLIGLMPRGTQAMMNKIIFQKSFKSNWDKQNVIECYNEHNERVKDVCPPDKLLVFEVSEGWKPLCAFLEVPIPDVPFPHVNDTKHFQGNVRMISWAGNSVMGFGLLGITVAAVLTVRSLLGNNGTSELSEK